jgi:hypothetical protein
MHTTIDQGHSFDLQNRCASGECVDSSFQSLQFLKIEDGDVTTAGVFTQDVMDVLIERSQWQHDNTPYGNADIEALRQQAIYYLVQARNTWQRFVDARLSDGAKLLGHTK